MPLVNIHAAPLDDSLNRDVHVHSDEGMDHEHKTVNTFLYELNYNDADTKEKTEEQVMAITQIDLGFNGTDHAKTDTYQANKTDSLFFTNKDSTNCGYSKCEIRAQGCIWAYTQTPYLTINTDAPFTVKAQTDIVDGYNTTFCMKCSNSV